MRGFVNTDEFRRDALNFLKYGYYTDAVEGTKDWEDYWDEQLDRCENGYSVGGVKITGYHYFYLNFNQILVVPKDLDPSENPSGVLTNADKVQTFPAFWDGDYEYFWAIDIARRGISQEDYDKLGLQTKILDLRGGKHLVVLKARGKGYSYKAGSMLARNFLIHRKSKNFAIAEEKEYLIVDGLLNKVADNVGFCNAHTAFAQPQLKDTLMHRQSGYMVKEKTGYTPKGRKSEVVGVTLKNNPDKARGKRGELIFYEEAGKCPSLLQAWEINRPSVEQGSIVTGLMVAFGTGGTEDADYAGLEELFYHPTAYNCLPFENIWDEGAQGKKSGFFVPSYQNWEGYMDADGNSDEEGAKGYLNNERELKKEAKDNSALDQFISENPFTPQEATLQVTQNIFPTLDLTAQLNKVEVSESHKAFPAGVLIDAGGEIIFRPTREVTPIYKYPVRKGDDDRGAVVVYEAPWRDDSGKVPEDLYIVVLDPFAKDKDKKNVKGNAKMSLGAAYVFKMWNNFSMTFMGCPVASYVGRPETMDEYNENLLKLAQYYNAKICFENNRGNLVEYCKRTRQLEWLAEEPSSAKLKTDKKKSGEEGRNKVYGLTTTEEIKDIGEVYIRDWLKTDIGGGKKVLHNLFDPALLTELIKYKRDGNFDRVMALLVGQFYLKELLRKQAVPKKPKTPLSQLLGRKMFA